MSRTDAPRAHLHSFYGAGFVIPDTYLLKIWIPYFARFVVRMAYIVADGGTFSAYVADSRHLFSPLRIILIN